MRKFANLLLVAIMFIIWDFEPGVKDTLEIAPTPNGPWNYYGPIELPSAVNGQYKVPVLPAFEKSFFRVKREIVFDILPRSK
jgi:hypothetical protein